ncbi:aminotransferase class V-fold PLP-dependent enzyme [Pedobacter sp. HMF7647]|uniref:Aminotransferase class V-fold PLP-dependent enzyme n=1 Tax=Hufsiella arboris TaxID=2695275 RepID=A0A7K1Y8V9_9SPHI|nr:aminotransferase class V-fold PLP-dependent enzyme [Hufsiella arboris]MXV51026.1 aminotransferase class V-fold PLP-dependent enzyme [Hufsiella arboris]
MISTDAVRNDFELNDSVYLMNHSAGRPLKQSSSNLSELFFEPWKTNEPWPQWLQALTGFQESLGLLLNSEATNFCPQTNVSSALTKIISSLPKREGRQQILLSEHDFPSVGFVASQAKKPGYGLKFLSRDADHTDPVVWGKAMSEDVQWVIITQAQSNTGVGIPVKEILDLAKKRQVITIVDVAQSVGVLPIDLQEWNADFVIGSCLKWLCGGPGAGFLYVNPEIISSCEPVDVGWFSHENPFEFDIHNFRYNSHAWRFFGGTPSVVPFILAAQSIRYLTKIGTTAVRNHNLALTQKLIDSLDSSYLVSPGLPAKRTGTVILHFGDQHETITARLKANDIAFDSRALGIRLSPHIYTTTNEMEKLVALINK